MEAAACEKLISIVLSISLCIPFCGCAKQKAEEAVKTMTPKKGQVNIKLLGETKVIMENPDSKHNYFGWPTVAAMPDGKIFVGASGFRLGHVCPFGKGVIAVSEDQGETYTSPMVVIDSVLDDRDVGLTPFGENGLIVTSFSNDPDWQFTLMKPQNEPYERAYIDSIPGFEKMKNIGSKFVISYDGGVTYSQIYRSPITSPHGPTVCSDGKILWVGNHMTDTLTLKQWPLPENSGNNTLFAYALNPENGDMTYVGKIDPAQELAESASWCEPHMVEAPDGTLICQIRLDTSGGSKIYQCESSDGGKTWTEPHYITDGCPPHLLVHSSGAIIGVYGYRHMPTGIRAMISWDNGKTWRVDQDIYVNGITTDLGYASTCELADGSMLTTWYAAPSDSAPTCIMQQKWTLCN